MAELIIFSGKLKGRRLILPDQRDVIVGRDEDCQMRIASSLVSRKHCVLRSTPEGILVRDLESQNGTYVNDVAIAEQFAMKPGDVLRVGSALFQVQQSKPVAPKKQNDAPKEQLSDDEISSWISDQEQTIGPSNTDTTVIKGRQPPQSSASLAAVPSAGNPTHAHPPTATPPRQPPAPSPHRTVKEQAAEIIKRHREMMRENT